jgi:prepilin-type N-terminal cleavage/methylation domain-containing protein/prepilin-type processing-associated H-X9-DG protein
VCENPLTPPRHGRGSRAFTLLELLVVILIIAVLAALVFPAFGVVRARMNQTQCMHQLRNWGRVISLYANDNERVVGWKTWAPISHDPATASVYQPYFQTPEALVKARMCPAHVWKPDGKSNPPPTYVFVRPTEGGKILMEPTNLTRVAQPSQLLLMIDAIANTGITLRGVDDFDAQVQPAITRHTDGANALFADFHVEWVAWKRLDANKPDGNALRKKWLTVDAEP